MSDSSIFCSIGHLKLLVQTFLQWMYDNKQIFGEVKSDIHNYSVELVIFDDALAESHISNARLTNYDVRFYRAEYMFYHISFATLTFKLLF